jgi:putative ABC transport system permease protein
MLGIGKGAEKQLMDNLGELAKNQLQVYQGYGEGKQLPLTTDTVNYLEQVFPELQEKISYTASNYMQLSLKNAYGGNEGLSYYGVPKSRFDNNDKELLYGSFFTTAQYENQESVTILSEEAYKYFFGKKNPIGEKVELGGKIFAVVGVLKDASAEYQDWKSYDARIPFPTFAARFPNNANFSYLTIYLAPTADNAIWQKRVSYALMKFYNISHISELNFTIDSFSKYIDEMKDQQKMMNYLLLAIGSISLLV